MYSNHHGCDAWKNRLNRIGRSSRSWSLTPICGNPCGSVLCGCLSAMACPLRLPDCNRATSRSSTNPLRSLPIWPPPRRVCSLAPALHSESEDRRNRVPEPELYTSFLSDTRSDFDRGSTSTEKRYGNEVDARSGPCKGGYVNLIIMALWNALLTDTVTNP